MRIKKVLACAAAAAMVVGSLPMTAQAAPTLLKQYTFENGLDDLTSAGLGTDPTIVDDAQHGKVLQFANGEASKLVTQAQDQTMNDYSIRYEKGTPSALKFTNPYKGKKLTGATISFWVKGSTAAAESGAGIIGFKSGDRTDDHPDKKSGEPGKQHMEPGTGPYVLGITCGDATVYDSPIVAFSGLFHNSYYYKDESGNLSDSDWHYVVVSLQNGATAEKCGDNITKVFVDGVDIQGTVVADKRYNDGETGDPTVVNGVEVNKGQPFLMDFLSWDDVEAYIGEAGQWPTSSDVMVDDISFYEGAASESDAKTMYTTAQASMGANAGGQQPTDGQQNDADNQTSDGGSNDSSSDGGSNSGSNNSSTGNKTSSANKTNTAAGSNTQTSNLPQTGVIDSSLLIACGVAAVVAGALLFRKKESKNEQ